MFHLTKIVLKKSRNILTILYYVTLYTGNWTAAMAQLVSALVLVLSGQIPSVTDLSLKTGSVSSTAKRWD